MSLVTRMVFAPLIVSAYTIYGVSAAKRLTKRPAKNIDVLNGAVVGFSCGAFYVLTGARLGDFI